jgi:hypothetical protein
MTTQRAAIRGALLGVAVFFPFIVGVTFLAGGDTIGALALAGYGSFFGGMGFGAMLGAVIQLVRAEEAEEARRAVAGPEPSRRVIAEHDHGSDEPAAPRADVAA